MNRNGGLRSADELADVVRRLRSVAAASVVLDDDGGVEAVHVLGRADRSPKLIAIDVVAALSAEFGLTIEPRQVRVAAQRQDEETSVVPQARLKFVGLSVSVVRGGAQVKVHLDDRGMMYEGEASGPAVPRYVHQLVAQATLHALEVFLRAPGMLLLEGVSVPKIGEADVAVVTVTLAGDEEETLAGASVVRSDPREAVVRAVLSAVNRPISWLTAKR
jgi:hypothetical protein